jgi:hypothetical protein
VNDQAILLGYIAFSVIKKLIPKAELLEVFPQEPYVSIQLDLPFALDETFITVIKEELKKTVKESLYKVTEMVPSVALSYAKSRKQVLEIDENCTIVKLLETPFSLAWIKQDTDLDQLDPKLAFDCLEICRDADTLMVFAIGDQFKELKKNFKSHYSKKHLSYLKEASFINDSGSFTQRGQDLINYYQNFAIKPLIENGIHRFECEEGEDQDIAFKVSKDSFIDPFLSVNQFFENPLICLKTSFSLEKLNSYLKSVKKIPKMLGFSYEIDLEGKFQQADIAKLDFEKPPSCFGEKEGKKLVLSIVDVFGRKIPFMTAVLMKKTMEIEVSILTMAIASLHQNGRFYPLALDRPKQVAFTPSKMTGENAELYLTKRLKGESCFILNPESKNIKQLAESYQIDEWID